MTLYSFVPELGKTTAELSSEQKMLSAIEAKALQKMKQLLMQQEEMKQ